MELRGLEPLTPTGTVTLVDFDDLGLAPFGYDLAKLVVSAAMTHGQLGPALIETTLDAYNTALSDPETTCPAPRFRYFAELHHHFTSKYLHQHGYQYSWNQVRP
ncbi:hypothetical protein [Nocardia terpenica]|uniref:Aminoglycoside phosphotransferase domain-containing protein n=1 Tax=Nocardia terpenica TaxID=455432 RepID=A0A6G9ZDE0_9NOCA|nr:hypothetical protein [Nocardia terpenica]QIS23464.1 hypothetical protein F6W96_39325 [Nocardia terpenica]